jgi:hypothetical protein
VYKTVCLNALGRLEEAKEWYRQVESNIEKYKPFLSKEETVLFAELEGDLELALVLTKFSGYDEELQMNFPTSKEEYLAGKKQFEKAREYDVGSQRFAENCARIQRVFDKAEKKVYTGNNLIWLCGTCMAPIGLLFLWIYQAPIFIFTIVYSLAGSYLYKVGSRAPGYLLAKRYKEAQMIQAFDFAMFNTFANTKNSRWRITYNNGRVEHRTGNEQLQVGITFLVLKLGFFLWRVTAFTWIGLWNLYRNNK